ncbi:glycosyltransferase [Paenibacillus sp. B-A-8]|uniref:glycosyltransferase n=1 Tax=Paenibacillus sp. B-A-8 TaxID=3400419 RepID=UPI003B02CEB0
MPLVSVIIPCYNSNKNLLNTINSIKTQEYKNIEIIIVNDGSNNLETINTINNLKIDRLQLYNINNHGVSYARNFGAQMATGKYLFFIDDDDLIDTCYINKAVEILEKYEQVALVYCFARRFGKDQKIWWIENFSYKKLLCKNCLFISSMVRKSDFSLTSGFNENMNFGLEDWDFWIRFLSEKKYIYRINEILFFYRINEISRTTSLVDTKEKIYRMYLNVLNNNFSIYLNNTKALRKYKIAENNNIFQESINKVRYLLYVIKVTFYSVINKKGFKKLFKGKLIKI